MNYIITNNKDFFEKIGEYNYCSLSDMVLPKVIAIDTETTTLFPKHGYIFSVQIGTGENNYLIDLQKIGNELVFEDVIPYIKDKILVGHNLTFDLGWFYKHNFFPKKVHDTFIASKLLSNGLSYSLHDFGSVMEKYLGVVYDKSEQKNIARTLLSNKSTIQYCFNDVDRLLELLQVLGAKIRQNGLIETYKLHCAYIRVLAYMEQCGLPIDTNRWKEKIKEDVVYLQNIRQEVINYIYDNIPKFRDYQIDMFDSAKRITVETTSSQQMISVFEELGINVINPDDSSKKNIKEDVIKRTDHEFVDLWLKYKSAEHDITTYGENILEKVEEKDGRIYTTFNPILDTARISTMKGGVNILNLPANERTRKCIKAKDGYKMVVADYEGQENVVGADLHQDPIMVASIKDGLDLHCAFAMLIFPETLKDLSDEDIKEKHSKLRQFAKSARFAKSYGGAGFTIAKKLNISEEEGERLSLLYDELHPGVKEWGEKVLEDCIKNGYIESADGFKLYIDYFTDFKMLHNEIENHDSLFWSRYRKGKAINKDIEEGKKQYNEYKDDKDLKHYLNVKPSISSYFSKRGKLYRLSLNNPVQTTSAHQTKRAAIMLFDEIEKNNDYWNVKICNIPHDEFNLEVVEPLAEKYARILERCMIEGGNYYLKSGLVSMSAVAKIADTWYEAK